MKKFFVSVLLAVLGLAFAQDEEVPYVEMRVVEETDTHRLVEHSLGQTEVPLEPQRIVALDHQIADNLLALGVTPVGAMVYDPPYLEPFEGTFTELPGNADLEAVLALEPDLILTSVEANLYSPLKYDQLTSIAPVVGLDDHPEHARREWTRDLGAILGMENEARARMAEHQALLDETRTAVQEAIGDETVAFFNVRQREFRLYGDEGYTSVLYRHGLDLNPPTLVRELTLGKANEVVSLELIPQLEDADHLFLLVNNDAGETLTEVENSVLWQNLPAVGAGNESDPR